MSEVNFTLVDLELNSPNSTFFLYIEMEDLLIEFFLSGKLIKIIIIISDIAQTVLTLQTKYHYHVVNGK